MNKRILSLALLSLLLLSAYIPIAVAHEELFPPGYSYTSMTLDVTGSPESLDPAWAYDSVSEAVIMNVYETLLFFDPLWSLGPYQPYPPALQRVESFVPQIASALPTVVHYDPPETNPKSGLPVYVRFTFLIRTGVEFHHGAFADPDGSGPLMGSDGILRARDVEYSIERVLVQDRVGGPAWLLYEPLLGIYEAQNPVSNPDFGLWIDGAVEVVGDSVQFNLAIPYPDMAFKQILSGTCASIVSEAWAANEGDLNMNLVTPIPPSTNPWSNWEYIHDNWWNPSVSFLEDAIDRPDPMKDGGTGPYRMNYWTRGVAWSIRKFDDYLAANENLGRTQSWPAPVTGSIAPLGGYLSTVTWYLVPTWATRLADLLSGTRDVVEVPRNYRDQVLGQVVAEEPIRCYYPFTMLSASALFFTMDINPASTWVGTMQPANTFSTAGVPPNIFGKHTVTDVDEGLNVRKAFAAAWDYGYAITQGYLDEADQPSDPIVQGLAYDDPTVPDPVYDLNMAEYYLKLAWGGNDDDGNGIVDPGDEGDLWNGGMKMTCVYPTASVPYQLALEKMVPEINALGGEISPGVDRFQLSIGDLDWGTRFLPEMEGQNLPVFATGWLADFFDPHSFIQPFMHSQGVFGYCQQYSDPFADAMVEQGILIPDPPATGWEDTVVNPTYSAYKDRDYSGAVSVGDWLTVTGALYEMYEVTALGPLTATTNRERIYYDLQQYYVEQVPSTMVFQPVGRQFEIAWCRGWYDNKLLSGNYWYHWWKAKTHFGDFDWDGEVDFFDYCLINVHWSLLPGIGGFNPRADVSGGVGGTVYSEYGLVKGIPDGKVDEIDKSLVNGYWDDPLGPTHP